MFYAVLCCVLCCVTLCYAVFYACVILCFMLVLCCVLCLCYAVLHRVMLFYAVTLCVHRSILLQVSLDGRTFIGSSVTLEIDDCKVAK